MMASVDIEHDAGDPRRLGPTEEANRRGHIVDKCNRVLSEWCQRFSEAIQFDTDSSGPVYSPAYGAEMPNFVHAWQWAAQHQRWELHTATLPALRIFFAESGRVSEARSLLAQVLVHLKADPSGPQQLLARLLEALGRFDLSVGDMARARAHLDEAMTLTAATNHHDQAQLLQTIGILQLSAGEVDAATASFRDGIALVAEEPTELAAALRYDLAQAHHYRGEDEAATEAARAALQAGRAARDPAVMTLSYLLLAAIAVDADPERAIVLLNEGRAIADDASLESLAIYFPHMLGLAHLKIGSAEVAQRYFSNGVLAAESIGRTQMVSANLIGRGEAGLLAGQQEVARDDVRDGIRLALKANSAKDLMWAAVVSCKAATDFERADESVRNLLALVLNHPGADSDARAKASEILAGLPASADSDEATNTAVTLDEVAERSLQLLALQ